MKRLFERAKGILINPRAEFGVITAENQPHGRITSSYLLVLAAIPAAATLLYWLFFSRVAGGPLFGYALKSAIVMYIWTVGGAYLSAYVFTVLAMSFETKKDFEAAFRLVAYSMTPALIAGVFHILHRMSLLPAIGGVYSLVLLYMGIEPLLKTPKERVTPYFIMSLLVMIVGGAALSYLLNMLFGIRAL